MWWTNNSFYYIIGILLLEAESSKNVPNDKGENNKKQQKQISPKSDFNFLNGGTSGLNFPTQIPWESLLEFPGVVMSDSGKPLFTGLYSGPYFDMSRTPNNVTVEAGGAAKIPCKVKQLGGKTVSWIRSRDAYILGVDDSTFISDPRFKILKPQNENEWSLYIKPVLESDAGKYECQISSKLKMSHYVRLKVIKPILQIEGDSSDIHAQSGSLVVLNCILANALSGDGRRVYWYKDEELLEPSVSEHFKADQVFSKLSDDFESQPPGNAIIEGLSLKSEAWIATLSLPKVQPSQSGKYSCRTFATGSLATFGESGEISAETNLHVINGEILAAMSDETSSSKKQSGHSDTSTKLGAAISSVSHENFKTSTFHCLLFIVIAILLLMLK